MGSKPASNARLPQNRAVRPKIIFEALHPENIIEALKESGTPSLRKAPG